MTIVHGQSSTIPRDTTYTVWSTYQKLKKQYPDIKPVSSFQIFTLKEEFDVIYNSVPSVNGSRSLFADLFYPKTISNKLPAVIMVHGGGWRSGDKSMNIPLAQKLAERGYVVMSVEYQLSLEAKYPVSVHNLKSAVRWLRANARRFNIDESKIAIMGASAGGQLATLIGATNNNVAFEGKQGYLEFSSSVQAVIDLDGLLDFTDPENLAVKRNEKSADVFWLESTYQSNPEKWKSASALYHVNSQSPPYLFINSSQTRFHAGCQSMIDKLNSLNIKSEVIKLDDAPHSFWLFYPWFESMTNHIISFLDKTLKDINADK